MEFSLQSIIDVLSGEPYSLKGREACIITNAATLQEASDDSVVWIKPGKAKTINLHEVRAALLICNEETYEQLPKKDNRSYLLVEEPKRIFSKIVNQLFVHLPQPQIHPAAFVHPEAIIGKDCYIGPFTYLDKCIVGNNTIIYGHCYIYDKVIIGDNCIIHAGVVIGSDGFGYAKDENGAVEKFPHIGGVIIGNRVEIGANSCIDKGALGNTQIQDGAKIDNLVHVAHNVIVGENAFLIANAMIGGSTVIEKGAWIAPSASVLQQLTIGANAIIGVGAVVTKNVPADETWTGSPAKPLQEFLALQKKIKSL